jgi:hypothetical protein
MAATNVRHGWRARHLDGYSTLTFSPFGWRHLPYDASQSQQVRRERMEISVCCRSRMVCLFTPWQPQPYPASSRLKTSRAVSVQNAGLVGLEQGDYRHSPEPDREGFAADMCGMGRCRPLYSTVPAIWQRLLAYYLLSACYLFGSVLRYFFCCLCWRCSDRNTVSRARLSGPSIPGDVCRRLRS